MSEDEDTFDLSSFILVSLVFFNSSDAFPFTIRTGIIFSSSCLVVYEINLSTALSIILVDIKPELEYFTSAKYLLFLYSAIKLPIINSDIYIEIINSDIYIEIIKAKYIFNNMLKILTVM